MSEAQTEQGAAPAAAEEQQPQEVRVIVTSAGERLGRLQTLSGLFATWIYNFRRTGHEGKQERQHTLMATYFCTVGVQEEVLVRISNLYFDDEDEFKTMQAELQELVLGLQQLGKGVAKDGQSHGESVIQG